MTKKWKHHKIDKTFLQDQKDRSVHGEYGWLDRKRGTTINSVWWCAYAESRLDHFAALCGGDRDAAKLMCPLWLNVKERLGKHIRELSAGWVFMLETYVMLLGGMAPDFKLGPNGKLDISAITRIKQNASPDEELWVDSPPGFSWLVTNQRLAIYEHDWPSSRHQQWQQKIDKATTSEAHPRTVADLRAWIRDHNRWADMPRDEQSYEALALPKSLANGVKEAVWKKASANLQQLGFDAEGKGKVRPVKKVLLPDSVAEFWDEALSVFLSRPHPDSVNDHPSYRKQPVTGVKKSAILLDQNHVPVGAKGVAVDISKLDDHGLVSATGVGISISFFDDLTRNKPPLATWERKFGSHRTGVEMDILAKTAAIVRASLAVNRYHKVRPRPSQLRSQRRWSGPH